MGTPQGARAWKFFPTRAAHLPRRAPGAARHAALGPLWLALALSAWAMGSACGRAPEAERARPERTWTPDDPAPPTARMQQVEAFRSDLAAVRHASDGGGSAELILEPGERATVRAGWPAQWRVRFTVGPEGLAESAGVYFMPEPFWGWSPPQDREPRAPGYTRVSTEAEGVLLETETLDQMLLTRIGGRAMRPGETILFHYGSSERGAQADLYAERGARLWFSVDGDGDGVRKVLAGSPRIDVLPGPAERLVVHATSVVRPGEEGRITLALLDGMANPVPEATGTVEFEGAPASWKLEPVALEAADRGKKTVTFRAAETGVFRLSARIRLSGAEAEAIDGREARATSNPIWVDPDAPAVYWGDVHGHSNYSDGTGLPEDYFAYARDIAGLDVSALTDHDHFGVLFLDQNPDLWQDIRLQTERFHQPGRFVTLLGLEWTSWIHGHRHVLYFSDEGEVLSSIDPELETPRQLWDALRGKDALTFAHHSAGEPIPTNWTFAPDPELEPVTEIMSVHGSSEASDSPARVRGALSGNFVRDVIDRGYKLGFIGSGDGHDGHPGLPHLSPTYGFRHTREGGERMGNGGLAGLQARELSRAGVLECLRARRVFATSGPRIVLDAALAGHPMGSSIPAAQLQGVAELGVALLAAAPLVTLDVVRSGEVVTRYDLDGELDVFTLVQLDDLRSGEYVYLRAVQEDGGMVWSSPFFVD